MKRIKEFITKRKLTLVSGVEGIGKQTFYLNLLIKEFRGEKVLIFKNCGSKNQTIDKLNKILYADAEIYNEFNSYIINEEIKNIMQIESIIKDNNDSKLIIIDRIDKFDGNINDNIIKLSELSKEYNKPILIIKDMFLSLGKYKQLEIEDVGISNNVRKYIDGFILLNRENYYKKRESSNLVIETIDLSEIPGFYTQEYKYSESYDALYSSDEINEEFVKEQGNFNNIAGYENIKKELLLIKSWWDNKEELENKGIDLPHGLLLYGPIGTGKSLFAREFVNMFPNASVVKIKNDADFYGEDEITKKFEYARGLNKLVFILIDELDYVAKRYGRSLLTQLDGLGGNNKNIFVVATCNGYENIDKAITRRGRIDYIIGIGRPTSEERINLLKFYFDKYGIKGDFDYDYLSIITSGQNAVNIKAITNTIPLKVILYFILFSLMKLNTMILALPPKVSKKSKIEKVIYCDLLLIITPPI